ncbi:KfrA_N domain-containing protein [Vibrio chagasii]|nr:KfrA_N domain-containing protein [Vibrio chagasii]
MARPKSYADEDIIKIATQLMNKGKNPTGWHIKEALGRGKISAIQSDLERLIDEGRIAVANQIAADTKESKAESTFLNYDLPAELQDLLARREEELRKVLRDMTIELNNKAHEHYESMMTVRIRDLDAKYNLSVRAKERAETEAVDIEERLQKQVEEKEQLEDRIEVLEAELADSKQSGSELLQQILHLTNNLNAAAEKYETLQGTHRCLNEQLLTLEKEHTALKVTLEFTTDENENLKSRLANMSKAHDEARDHVAETRAKLTASQDALHRSEKQRDKLMEDSTQAMAVLRFYEESLPKPENMVISSTEITENQ